jgi:glycosyltransferase involved in cell wall biosynthesis
MPMRLLIAIPVFNEEKYVRDVIGKVSGFHPDVLVVDDCSTDRTAEILADIRPGYPSLSVIRHPVNGGYGKSLIDAFTFARENCFDWVITMDCDEQHEPEMIPAFIEEIKTDRWDLISGSRYKAARADDQHAPTDRLTVNRTITATLNRMYHWQLTDAFCGFKAHRVSALAELQLTETGYAFPLQLWPQVAHYGLRMTELPVRRIYLDPNRHFGGTLDDPAVRLNHYLDVLHAERQRLAHEPASTTKATKAHRGSVLGGCTCCK